MGNQVRLSLPEHTPDDGKGRNGLGLSRKTKRVNTRKGRDDPNESGEGN